MKLTFAGQESVAQKMPSAAALSASLRKAFVVAGQRVFDEIGVIKDKNPAGTDFEMDQIAICVG